MKKLSIKRCIFFIAAITVLVALLGLTSAMAGDEAMKFGLSLSTLNNPFFVSVKDGAQAEADILKVSLTVTDAQNRLDKQISDIEDLIQKKVDVLLINPTDSAGTATVVKRANKAGIPVFAIDRAIDVSVYVSSYSAHNNSGVVK